jgi:hypothetical protein
MDAKVSINGQKVNLSDLKKVLPKYELPKPLLIPIKKVLAIKPRSQSQIAEDEIAKIKLLLQQQNSLAIEKDLRKQEKEAAKCHSRQIEFEAVKIRLEALIKNLDTLTDGYIHVEFRNAVANTRWSFYNNVLPKVSESEYLRKFITEAYFGVCGLSLNRKFHK